MDKDVPKEKLLGIYELHKFDAKHISERMFSILYEIDLRNLVTSTMLLWSVGDVDKTLWSATFNGDISLCFGFNEGTRALLGL